MPETMAPEGYQAVFLGSTASFSDLGAFSPLEESAGEGALFLMQLDFVDFPSDEVLAQLEQGFTDAGVEMWPGYGHFVYADLSEPTIYLAWQKGFAWLPIIIGLLVTVVLPPLLGGLIWQLMPQSLKDLISGIVNMGIMMLVMWLMTTMMKPLTATEKTKKVKEAKPEQLEEAKT